MKYVTMFAGYKPENRFCKVVDPVSRTIQDAIVDIPSLLKEFNGRLDDLFDRFNNGLVYESMTGVGVFYDELSPSEVAKYNKFVADKAKREADAKEEARLFEQFKIEVASRVASARSDSPAPATLPASDSKE